MRKELNAEIIAVGTELLLGQITNTNAAWIAEQLALNGINTFYHTVVGDNLERLTEIFRQAQERSDTIIITGGLGPTEDDLSREAFQKLSGLSIVTDQQALDRIQAFFDHKGETMTENNRRQARIFEHSTVLENLTGMAPGNLVEYEGARWIFMPGVPREMKQIFTDSVLPYLANLNGGQLIHSTVLRFAGIGESLLEEKLHQLITEQNNPTIAPLATDDGVTIRISAKAASADEAASMIQATREKIMDVVGEHYYGQDDETIEQKTAELLMKHQKTISSAESLTGGLFADKMVDTPGISSAFKGAIVCYAPEIKEHILHIPEAIIQEEGTVSEKCAELLARNVSNVMKTDIGISFTGAAGPDSLEGHPPGTVYIGLFDKDGFQEVERSHFQGDRKAIRYRSVLKGYEMLLRYLKKLK